MIAILKREWKSYFQNITGWLFIAAVLALYGLYFLAYNPVSYTHLDVYKRQLAACSQPGCEAFRAGAFVPTVRTDDQGRAADQGGGDALFLCAARL